MPYKTSEDRRAAARRRYKKDPTKWLKKNRRNVKRNTAFLLRYKRSICCAHCGYSFKDHPSVCDFHHRDPESKEQTIAHLVAWSIGRIKKEIRKCIPLCANCHRILHNE